MADAAQSSVDSLLGRLSSVLLEQAQLLRGVRGDVRFIKNEMEIMNGFLLDLADVENPNNQVRAWTRQVRDLATDSQNCIDRYVQSLGARPPTAGGLLGCLRQVPHLARTMPTRHRIATQIRELKSRTRELGERRLRYGIKAPPPDSNPSTPVVGDGSKEEEDEERRRALADVTGILEEDAREVIGWLTEELNHGDQRHRRLRVIAITRMLSQETEHSLARRVFDHPCTSSWFDCKVWIEVFEKTASQRVRKLILQQVLQQLAPAAAESKQETGAGVATSSGQEQQQARAATESKQEPGAGVATSSGQEQQQARAAAESKQEPGAGVTTSSGQEQQLDPAAAESKQEPAAGVATSSGQEQRLARAAADSKQEPGAGVATASDVEQQLVEKIKDHLRGKRILIVAANDPDGLVRKVIESDCVPADAADGDGGICSPGSAIIVTAGRFWERPRHNRYRAFFTGAQARGRNGRPGTKDYTSFAYKTKDYTSAALFGGNAHDLIGGVDEDKAELLVAIMLICRGDFFCTEMFLRALYVNPNRTKAELPNLLNSLRVSGPLNRRKARKMVEFCYNGLPSHHKRCLLYLSIYPPDSKVRRTSLVRRWAAENIITKRDGMSEADESERCFNALVAWGLVRPVNIGAAGKVKSCKVHPHVLSFVAKIAKDENASNTGLQPELAHRGIQLQKRSEEDANAAEPPNTCWNWSICERLKGSKAPSNSTETPSNSTETLFESLQASSLSGLVKVLDLEGCEGLSKRHLKYICNNISLLRYLSLRKTGVDELPKEIEKLQCLETLDIRETKVRAFATKSIVLRKLKHLLAGSINSPSEAFSTVLQMPRGIRHMTDLQILSHVEVSNSEKELMDVGELHQLRKLGVVLCGKEAHLNHLFQVITKLNECLYSLSVQMEAQDETTHDFPEESATFSPPRSLVSLSISGKISGLPTWISKLRRLSKITLRGTYLTDLRILGSLANLHCLRLRDKSYMESTLTFIKAEFPSLKFLLVEGSEIQKIHFDDEATPKLEKITWSFDEVPAPPSGVKNLPCLEEIGNLSCLEEIELSSNWDRSCVIRLISEAAKHANHPVVTHPIREATAASITSTPK